MRTHGCALPHTPASRRSGRQEGGRLMLAISGGLAEFERDLIRSRTGEGQIRAKARGIRFGRKPKLSADQQAYVARQQAVSAFIPAGLVQSGNHRDGQMQGQQYRPSRTAIDINGLSEETGGEGGICTRPSVVYYQMVSRSICRLCYAKCYAISPAAHLSERWLRG
ncbi:recombinase family protein [Aquabacter sp. CN5-332]|uniref:recombinase family protein n=1 Tax=Aquabacter sp. CN5-332 TaxID=3156608 RepID=UPI0032B4F619